MSDITDFYYGLTVQGKNLSDILAQDDDYWENTHDFIQWVFPLATPSQYNEDAPVLTTSDIIDLRAQFAWDSIDITRATHRFMEFLGFARGRDEYVITNYNRVDKTLNEFSHNNLRVTRVIKCLRLLGMSALALKVFDAVYYNSPSGQSGDFWKDAIYG